MRGRVNTGVNSNYDTFSPNPLTYVAFESLNSLKKHQMPCEWRCCFYSSCFKFAKNDSVHAIIWLPLSLQGRKGKHHHYQHHIIHVHLYFHVSLSFVPVFVFFLYPQLCPYFHTHDFPFSVFTPTPISQSILLSIPLTHPRPRPH